VSIQIDLTGAGLDDYLGSIGHDGAEAGTLRSSSPDPSLKHQRKTHGSTFMLHACMAAAWISTELALVSAENVYSFLGGTEPESFDVRPNDLLNMN